MKRSIIIMTKVPRAGNVKTRLQPFLAPEECKTLAAAFLSDAIFKARQVCDDLVVAFAPAGEESYFAESSFENLTLVEQRGANLGERMRNAFESVFALNSHARLVLIGTDSPTFPAAFAERAFVFLETGAEMVLGKSVDGGFYLIGLRGKIDSRLFENIEWSSPQVHEQVTRNAARLKIRLKSIPVWFDVDAPDDLRRLRREVLADETARKTAPQTLEWLVSNAAVFDPKL